MFFFSFGILIGPFRHFQLRRSILVFIDLQNISILPQQKSAMTQTVGALVSGTKHNNL